MNATAAPPSLDPRSTDRSAPTVPLLIAGLWIESRTTQWRAVTDPASGTVLARMPKATAEELGAAVDAAREAFPGWRRTPAAKRAAWLRGYRQQIRNALPELTTLLVAERGKTIAEATDELLRTVEVVGLAARIADIEMAGQVCTTAADIETRSQLEPLGVCAGITPFDDPALLPVSMFAVTVAAGNCIVLKPSGLVPLTLIRLAELALDAGLPPGVLNVVHGGEAIVNGLCDHPDIIALAFAGRPSVAQRVQQRAQLAGKRVYCDPAPRNHAIVLPDAPVAPTIAGLVAEAFGAAGQRSTAVGTVLLVGETRGWLPGLISAAAALQVGPGDDPASDLGPMVSATARAQIDALIAEAVAAGATLALDGRRQTVPTCPDGHFIGPTILLGPASAEVDRVAIHGPVLRVLEVATLDAAIARINDSAADPDTTGVILYTASRSAAASFADRIDARSIAINAPLAAAVPLPASDLPDVTELPPCIRAALSFCTRAGAVSERWFD